ncbi:MAG TPA: hypothetical protein VFY60_05200 [Pyrinomonadaceae bacterium]|nr:hypothetical protein [Pyrinomonadaceae bacterium]
MSNVVRNVLAVLAGLVIGSIVNMLLVAIGPMIIPPPAGADVSSMEALSKSMPLFEPRHFIMPFLAHALGSLVGATAAYMIAGSYKTQIALAIGVLFLLGGAAASYMLPAPAWFEALDLLVAYLPMAWLGSKIGARLQGRPVSRG